MRQERLRKSDHLNPLVDHSRPPSRRGDAGFRVARIRYYTPIVGGFVENILMRMAERQMAKRAAKRLSGQLDAAAVDKGAVREARTSAKAQIAPAGHTNGSGRAHRRNEARSPRVRPLRSRDRFSRCGEDGGVRRGAMKIVYSAINQMVPGTRGGWIRVAAVAEGLAAHGHDVTALITAAQRGVMGRATGVRGIDSDASLRVHAPSNGPGITDCAAGGGRPAGRGDGAVRKLRRRGDHGGSRGWGHRRPRSECANRGPSRLAQGNRESPAPRPPEPAMGRTAGFRLGRA